MWNRVLQIGLSCGCLLFACTDVALARGVPEPHGIHAGGMVIHPGAELDLAVDVDKNEMHTDTQTDGLIDVGAFLHTRLEDEKLRSWNNEVKFQWRQFWGLGDRKSDGGCNVQVKTEADLFKESFFRIAPNASYTFINEPEDEYQRKDFQNHTISAGSSFYLQPGGGAIFMERLSYNFYGHFYQERSDISYMRHRVESTTRWNFLPNTSMALTASFTPTSYLEDERKNSDINSDATTPNNSSYPFRIKYSLQGLLLPRLSYSLGAGYAYVYYTNKNTEHMFIMNARLTYEFSADASIRIAYKKDFDNSTYGDYQKYHRVTAAFNGFWFNHLETKLEVGYGRFAFQSLTAIPRTDNLLSVTANLNYYFFPGLSLGAEYKLRYNDSDIYGANYSRHLVTLGVRYEY